MYTIYEVKNCTALKKTQNRNIQIRTMIQTTRVAELGSLSSGAKIAMKIFVKRVFTIFATNASFLRVIANLQN